MTVISLDEHKTQKDGHEPAVKTRIVHLPVAPQVTAMTRFSSVPPRKLSFMMPEESLEYLQRECQRCAEKILMAAITGPGDPLAVPDTTLRTIDLVKKHYPDMKVGIKTLGIGTEKFASDMAAAGVSCVEMVVNGVKEEILEKLYAWIRPGQKTLKIEEAVKLLIGEQKNGIPALRYNDIHVSVETTMYPGINQKHVGMISRKMMELGADSIAVLPYIPEPNCEVVGSPPTEQELDKCRSAAARYLPVVEPLLPTVEHVDTGSRIDNLRRPKPTPDKPNVAVVSSNGVEIDMHLGKAGRIMVYGPRADGLPCLLDVRNAPAPGTGSARWKEVASIISDCFVLLAAQAGDTPRRILSENDISVLITDDQIDGVVDVLYGGGRKKKANKSKNL